jgi:hypothetical protein
MNIAKLPVDYPALTIFLSSWFHQDFDIEGETIAAIVAGFLKSCQDEQRRSLIGDISRFLSEICDSEMEEAFQQIFSPEIDLTAFTSSTRAFLVEILQHLS